MCDYKGASWPVMLSCPAGLSWVMDNIYDTVVLGTSWRQLHIDRWGLEGGATYQGEFRTHLRKHFKTESR